MLVPIHIVAGGLGLVLGALALAARKGSRLHRRSGLLFVCAMLVMACTGTFLALHKNPTNANAVGGLISIYTVVTALTTVRPPSKWTRIVTHVALAMAVAMSIAEIILGLRAQSNPHGEIDGVPGFMLFFFAAITTLGAAGDLRTLYFAKLSPAARLARHLWRMCFALFMATASFFSIPQRVAKVLPIPFTTPGLRALPIALVFAAMFYWLARVRFGRLPARSQ